MYNIVNSCWNWNHFTIINDYLIQIYQYWSCQCKLPCTFRILFLMCLIFFSLSIWLQVHSWWSMRLARHQDKRLNFTCPSWRRMTRTALTFCTHCPAGMSLAQALSMSTLRCVLACLCEQQDEMDWHIKGLIDKLSW